LKGKLEQSSNFKDEEGNDLIEVLKSLGYKVNDISRIIMQVDKKNSLEIQIKEALKLLLK
ncbi:MAG: RuvA C-terminal domain-containing protein, partial [Bacilli bacterium]